MKTIKAKIKETIEREVSHDVGFPLYLKSKDACYMVFDANEKAICFPHEVIQVSLAQWGGISKTAWSESEVAKNIETHEVITYDEYHNEFIRCVTQLENIVNPVTA